MRELYVYYRVPRAAATVAREAVSAAQAALRAEHPGLVARLLRRDGAAPADAQTWMETYARPACAAGVDAALQAAIDDAAAPLLAFIDGPRHVEAFDDDRSPNT